MLINGIPVAFFTASHAPTLFLLAIQAVSCILKSASEGCFLSSFKAGTGCKGGGISSLIC